MKVSTGIMFIYLVGGFLTEPGGWANVICAFGAAWFIVFDDYPSGPARFFQLPYKRERAR